MHRLARTLLVACSFSALAPAQNFLLVDANGAPSSFPDIQSAIDAAAPGDRVIVRSGSYAPFVLNKPLAIACEPGTILAAITGPDLMKIEDIPADTDAIVRGLRLFSFGGEGFTIENCQGRVLLDELTQSIQGDNHITDCEQVMINQSSISGDTQVMRSSITIADSSMAGGSAGFVLSPGVTFTDSTAAIARSNISGAAGNLINVTGGPGISATNSQITISGDATHSVAVGVLSFSGSQSAIVGDGTFEIDPDVVLTPFGGAPAVAPTTTITQTELPSLRTRGGGIGGTTEVDLFGDPGDAFFLLVGFPGNSLAIPGLGEIWLDLQNTGLFSSGTIDATGQESYALPVLNARGVLGIRISWVGLVGSSSLRLTNNSSYSHGLQ